MKLTLLSCWISLKFGNISTQVCHILPINIKYLLLNIGKSDFFLSDLNVLCVAPIGLIVFIQCFQMLLIDLHFEVSILLRMSLQMTGSICCVSAVFDSKAADLAVDEGWSLGEPSPDLGRVPRVSHHLMPLAHQTALCKYLVFQLLRLRLDV